MLPIARLLALPHRLAQQLLPAAAAPERAEFTRPALVAFAVAAVLLLAQSWPLSLFFAPAFVVGCRYHELSRFPRVRASRWTFLLLGAAAAGGLLWAATHPVLEFGTALLLGAVALSTAAAVHLFAAQRRLTAAQTRTEVLANSDDDGPVWAFAGALAILPILFLLAFVEGLGSWRAPLVLAWGLVAVPLLVLQLHRSAWFPMLAAAWLGVGVAIEVYGTLTASTDTVDDALIALAIVACAYGALAAYLLFGARARATFAAAAPGSWRLRVLPSQRRRERDGAAAAEQPVAAQR